MKIEDLKIEQDRLENEQKSLYEISTKLCIELEEQVSKMEVYAKEGDIEAFTEAEAEYRKINKQLKLITKLQENNLESTRRLLITMMGPAGAALFDAIKKMVYDSK